MIPDRFPADAFPSTLRMRDSYSMEAAMSVTKSVVSIALIRNHGVLSFDEPQASL